MSISEPIKKNLLPLLNRASSKRVSKSKLQFSSLKKDCNLFSNDSTLRIGFHDEHAAPKCDDIVIDGAAVVNILKPGPSKTFNEYSRTVFLLHLVGKCSLR